MTQNIYKKAFLLLFIAVASYAMEFRYSSSPDALFELESNEVMSKKYSTRLECASELNEVLDSIFKGSKSIGRKSYEKLQILKAEFKEELLLLELSRESNKSAFRERKIASALSGRFVTFVRNTYSHPFDEDHTSLNPGIYLNYTPFSRDVSFNFGARSTQFTPSAMKVDEANVLINLDNFASVRLGRVYFILGHLGLIGDNNFDAFEGAVAKIKPFGPLNFEVIYSRLSTTNYPRTTVFYDNDDYLATRVSAEFSQKRAELGVNTLFSGIASEDALSVDFYWKMMKNRELIAEAAFYRPSKTTLFSDVDPYKPRYAYIIGADVINEKSFSMFLQLGDVQKGFTPMATSLVYSAQNHLYFDQDTRGLDLTLSYFPEKKAEFSTWQTRPDRTGKIPKETIYELNFVMLFNGEWGPSQNRYILRYIRSFGNFRFYVENNLWDRYQTISWPERGVYNELRFTLVYEL